LHLCLHISVTQEQKTANFKAAFASRHSQWGLATEEKQNNQNCANFHFAKAIIIIIKTRAVAITRCPSPLYQHCTAAKDGKIQGCQSEQRNEGEFLL
jgi:hypothetical protein